MRMAFETLNRLRWAGRLGKCSVTIIHRGAPHDRKTIPGQKITSLKRSHFYYTDDNRETMIPLHRVLEIELGNEVIWRRSTRKG